jgi:hypothetical protein
MNDMIDGVATWPSLTARRYGNLAELTVLHTDLASDTI